jgi:hypothetical protein
VIYPPATIRLGSTLLWKGKGVWYEILSRLIKWFDPDPWVREVWDRWGWHLTQVVGQTDDGDWIIDEATAPHDRRVALSLCTGEYKVINWLEETPKQAKCDRFVASYSGFRYDPLSYLWTLLNRMTGGYFPVISDKLHNCWERNGCFNDFMVHPVYLDFEAAYMPLMLKRYMRIHDESPKIAIILNQERT